MDTAVFDLHGLYSLFSQGEGSVRFGASGALDLASLHPLEVLAAYYRVQSHTETYGRVLLDYLAERTVP